MASKPSNFILADCHQTCTLSHLYAQKITLKTVQNQVLFWQNNPKRTVKILLTKRFQRFGYYMYLDLEDVHDTVYTTIKQPIQRLLLNFITVNSLISSKRMVSVNNVRSRGYIWFPSRFTLVKLTTILKRFNGWTSSTNLACIIEIQYQLVHQNSVLYNKSFNRNRLVRTYRLKLGWN